MSVAKGVCPKATKAHYTRGAGNRDQETQSGTEPYKVSWGQVWQWAEQQQIAVYHQNDWRIWWQTLNSLDHRGCIY